MEFPFRKEKKLTSFQIIILGFLGMILFGTFLLMLPVSSRAGIKTPFADALFTATSAVCVTGLVVQDTASYWSTFGQILILFLIQIGGMGVVTVAASIALLSGRKISLMQRSTMQEAISAPKVGGIVRLTVFIIKTSFAIEFLGAVIMMPVFYRDFGLHGLWMAIFHSVSAFCNAGFDLMGVRSSFSSLTGYALEPMIIVPIIFLILIGGIGFLTWDDIRENKFRFHRYRMQSKVILTTSAVLLLLPAAFLFFYEFKSLPLRERIFYSLFQSVTPRTAGFNTVDYAAMTEQGQALTIALMLVGGSPGSTAGGMKTTTIAVLFASAIATFWRKEDTHFFERRIDVEVVRNASTIFMMYISLFFGGAVAISIIEGLPMNLCLFETASAVGTVGLTMGITTELGLLSRGILIVLMFFGRVGGLNLIFAALSGAHKNVSRYPRETITVG